MLENRQISVKDKAMAGKSQFMSFAKTKKGKIIIGVCILALILIIFLIKWNANSALREGTALCKQGEYAKAQSFLKKAVESDNMNAELYNKLGIAYLGSGEYDDAIRQFELALNLDNDSENSYRGLGIAYVKKKEYEKAIKYLDKAIDNCGIKVGEEEYDILWWRAEAEAALADYKAAVYTYGVLIEIEDDNALLRCRRGQMYCKLNDKKKALQDFDAAVSMKGNTYDVFWNIYDCLYDAGLEDEAAKYLKLTRQPGYIDKDSMSKEEIDKNEGIVYYICKDYKKALEVLSLESLKDDDQAKVYKALTYEKMNKNDKALQIYLENIKSDNVKADDYNRIARYFIRNNNGKKAVSYLKKGIKTCSNGDVQDLYYNMVSAYESYGDYEKAKEALEEYSSLYGSDDNVAHEMQFLKERIRK